jgi:hypothetical protein
MRRLAILAFTPLAACTIATSDATGDAAPPILGACRNDVLGQFTGQAASQELGARMLAVSGARILRWVPKGSVVTMEFSPDRVTVLLDGSNRVERASCG